MVITEHAEGRCGKRFSYTKEITHEKAEKALRVGVKHGETSGTLKKYIDKVYLKHKNANNTRIFRNQIYLFHNDILVTAWKLPREFWKIAKKLCKRKGVN